MRVQVSCIDFTSQQAVSECRVTCRVFAPRFTSAHASPGDGGSGGVPAILYASDQSPGGDDGEPVEIIKVNLDRAIELPAQTAVTGSTGRLLFEFDVAAGYAQVTAADGTNQHFHDAAALVQLRGGADGLTGQSQPILSTNSSDAPTGDVTLERITLMDFAKTIVGHTTQTTTRLWFQLHGSHPGDRRCECEIDRLGPDGHALADTPLQTLPITFDVQAAKTRLVDVAGLSPGQRYGYRLWLRPARGPIQPRSGRLLCEGMFSTARRDERQLTVLFGSCHKPLDTGFFDPANDLRQWRRIAARSDGDLLVLMGDQVYGDAVPEPSGGSRWFDGYVRRYNAFWAFQPLRQALARRPTYEERHGTATEVVVHGARSS